MFVTAFANIPTGRSIYDPGILTEGAGVTGHGQWGAGLGVTVRKIYFPWTLTLQLRSIELFAEEFGETRVSNFYDSAASFIVNYASRLWDLGFTAGVSYSHLSPRILRPSNVRSSITENTSLLFGSQKVITDSWSVGVSYRDQTLLGPARNSLLNRSINISANYNYF